VSLPPHVLVGRSLDGVAPGAMVPVDAATLRHLHRVLRLGVGAVLSLTDGQGRLAVGELATEGALIGAPVVEVGAPRPALVLAQALSKGRRAEDAVRVACELGVDRLVPVIAERTQGRPDARAASALVERWRAVAIAALEQSRGVRLSTIATPVEGLAGVALSGDAETQILRLIAVPGALPLPDVLSDASSVPEVVVVAVGPEGGWSPEEVARASEDGWTAVGLGPTVLRTEHAGPVAVAVTAALLGRWRSTSEVQDPG